MQPGERGDQVPPANKGTRVLDREEIPATHEARRTIHRGGRCGHSPNRIPTSCGCRRRGRCRGIGRDVRPHRVCKPRCSGAGRECGESTNLVPKGQKSWLDGSNAAAGHSCKSLVCGLYRGAARCRRAYSLCCRGNRAAAGLSVALHHRGCAISRPQRRRCAHRDGGDGKILGQSMVIENVGGAGGTIRQARAVAQAPAPRT